MPQVVSSLEPDFIQKPPKRPRQSRRNLKSFLNKHREIWIGLALGVLSSFLATRIESIISFVSAGRLDYEEKTQTLVVRTFPVRNSKVPTGEIDKYMKDFDNGSISGSEGFLVQAFLTIGPRNGSVNIEDGSQWIIQEMSIFYLSPLGEHFKIDSIQEISNLSGHRTAVPEREINCEVNYKWFAANQPTVKNLTNLQAPAEPNSPQLPYLVVQITTKKKSIFGASCDLAS